MNLGYTYYRNIGKNVDFGKNINQRANGAKYKDAIKYFQIKDSTKLKFKTKYPGLTIGLGYTHDSKKDDDFKLGFMFDYTTGLPYIPGSTLKGVLRSVFPVDKNDKSKIDFINYILKKEYTFNEIYEIEKSIFGKSTKDTSSKDNPLTKDIFYDGYLSPSNQYFLEDDYITPHESEIKSPKPLKFLKIPPGIEIVLQIKLSENNNLISKEDRLQMYIKILKFTGLGAKTNVGYGVVDINYQKIQQGLKNEKSDNILKSSDNPLDKAKVYIDKAKDYIDKANKPNETLFKKLRALGLSENRSDILNYYKSKFANAQGKWNDKIIKLLR